MRCLLLPSSVCPGSFLAAEFDRVSSKYAASSGNAAAPVFLKVDTTAADARYDEIMTSARSLERNSNLRQLLSIGHGASRPKRQAAGASATGVLPLVDDIAGNQDTLYYGSISVGSPAQEFNVALDTGSADEWIYGPNAPTAHTKFTTSASSTLETSASAWRIDYGTGYEAGYLARDVFTVAGLSVQKQIFALANTSVPIFESLPIDGVMGMFLAYAAYRTVLTLWVMRH